MRRNFVGSSSCSCSGSGLLGAASGGRGGVCIRCLFIGGQLHIRLCGNGLCCCRLGHAWTHRTGDSRLFTHRLLARTLQLEARLSGAARARRNHGGIGRSLGTAQAQLDCSWSQWLGSCMVRRSGEEIVVIVANDYIHRWIEGVRALVDQELRLRSYESLQSAKALSEHPREI